MKEIARPENLTGLFFFDKLTVYTFLTHEIIII